MHARVRLWLWLMLSLCTTVSTWLYVHRILEPWTNYSDAEKGEIIAQMGDLYSPWVGTRELLLHRRNPYGPEVSHEIQKVFYGHAVNQTYPPGTFVINEQRFAYPVYAIFLLAPTVYADFADVRRWARFVLGMLTAASVWLCLDILLWRLPREKIAALVLFTLSSPQIVQGLRFEQLALVVGFLLVAGAWCVCRNYLATAGALLAFSTIKPQMTLLPLCAFAVWAAGDWMKRRRLVAGFTATLAALFVAGELLLPGWLGYFLTGITAYRRYAPTSSLLRMILGDTFGEVLGALIVAGLLAFAWQNRKAEGGSRSFALILAAFFTGAILALPLFTPFNQVMLILPALLLLRDAGALSRFSRGVLIVSLGWPWIMTAALLLFPPDLHSLSQFPLLPSFMVPFVPLMFSLLLMARRTKATDFPLPAVGLKHP
jgi:hypothetical protein